MTILPTPKPQAPEQPWTIGRLLEWTTGYFAKQKSDTPRLDAEVLLAHLLACKRIELYMMYDAEVAESDRSRFRELVRKRGEGCPVAYLVGKREFYALDFEVTHDVLIPRPETEHLVGRAIELYREKESFRFLDVGTGSGAIAVTLAKELPKATGVAVDISDKAIAIAQKNATTHGVFDRIAFAGSDLCANLPAEPAKFDLVASNPPYITDAEMLSLSKTVRDYEPATALAGGTDGLRIIERLIGEASHVLHPGGRLLIEIGATQDSSVRELMTKEGCYNIQTTLLDVSARPRVVEAIYMG